MCSTLCKNSYDRVFKKRLLVVITYLLGAPPMEAYQHDRYVYEEYDEAKKAQVDEFRKTFNKKKGGFFRELLFDEAYACPICVQYFKKGEVVMQSRCEFQHVFHKDCLIGIEEAGY